MKISVFWFRRDLRLEDNAALAAALDSGFPVLPLFIFDTNITAELQHDDARISFIYETLDSIDKKLRAYGSSVLIMKGDPAALWKELSARFDISAVYINKDYEPYALERDADIEKLLKYKGIYLVRKKDQVIFEEGEIVKPDGKPYTIFTPYMKRWMTVFSQAALHESGNCGKTYNFLNHSFLFPSLHELGFTKSTRSVRSFDTGVIRDYHKYRDLPFEDRTSYLSPHLRFGTVSIRKIVRIAAQQNNVFLNELIWREFFMQILFHFPKVITENFKSSYDLIEWRNNDKEFDRWCRGETGYPIVDAGMRQLNETGYMHNRVRMIAAGFLCKHLLTDWRRGEAYFAEKLLDYDLSSNNGNWQWAAGTGCDAVPYFRIFNPDIQQKKFDPREIYIKRWTGESGKHNYHGRIVEHAYARQRAIEAYKSGLKRY